MGIWCAHGEGRAIFPDPAVLDAVLADGLAPIRCGRGAPLDARCDGACARRATELSPMRPRAPPSPGVAEPCCSGPEPRAGSGAGSQASAAPASARQGRASLPNPNPNQQGLPGRRQVLRRGRRGDRGVPCQPQRLAGRHCRADVAVRTAPGHHAAPGALLPGLAAALGARGRWDCAGRAGALAAPVPERAGLPGVRARIA